MLNVLDWLISEQCSAEARMLLVSQTSTNFGDRAFNAAGPRAWSYLLSGSRTVRLVI